MKKVLIILTVLIAFISPTFANETVNEWPDMKLIIDGNQLPVKDVPVIVNSRTLIPLRELLVGLGVPNNDSSIQWDGVKKAVKVVHDGKTIKLTIGSPKAYINSKVYTLDSAPIIYQSRTYLPARFIGEGLGYKIDWDGNTPAVLITSPNNYKNTEKIFNEMTTAMNKVKYYNTASITEVNGKEEAAIKEKADLTSDIVHTQKEYKQSNMYIFKYIVEQNTYLCTRYGNPYNIKSSEWSITEKDENKSGIVKIPKELYTALNVIESEDTYLIHNISNQYDLLKIFPEIDSTLAETLKESEIVSYQIKLSIDKTTKLPIMAKVQAEYINKFNDKEDINYTISYKDYNKRLQIELPDGL